MNNYFPYEQKDAQQIILIKNILRGHNKQHHIQVFGKRWASFYLLVAKLASKNKCSRQSWKIQVHIRCIFSIQFNYNYMITCFIPGAFQFLQSKA
jgi:hypothetical protein